VEKHGASLWRLLEPRQLTGTGMDSGSAGGDAAAMAENPYAIPVEDLVDSARVPVAEQVVEVPERRFYGDGGEGAPLLADGGLCDADGE
jgi:hypothetical protein